MGINVTKDEEKGKVDELVLMIDRLMEQGSGSLVIDVDKNGDKVSVSTYKTDDCTGKQGACMQPNESAVDEDIKEEEPWQ